MAWFIDPDINDGYPWQSEWPQEAQTDWSGELPYSAWRIQADVNGGYPWIWWWFKESSERSGEMLIGGSQTNYPSGFTSANRGGIAGQFDRNSMRAGGTGGILVNQAVSAGLENRQFIITGANLTEILYQLNNNISTSDADWVSKIYGTNVYDGFLCCKAYPFILSSTAEGIDCKMFGKILISAYKQTPATTSTQLLDMGEITLDIRQAWEVENIDYSIYLPYAGVYPLDVRHGATISVDLFVDLYQGTGEYYIYQDGQITAVHKCIIGADIPLNLNQGITQSNLLSNITSVITQGLPLAAGAVGTAIAGPAAGGMAAGIAGFASQQINRSFVQHNQISAPQVGGLTSTKSYPFVRILAKIPKMFKDGYGYPEIIGESRQCTYTQLSSCSGFTQCKDYKCDIIIATDAEKVEIERLLNAGVFL